MVVSESYDRNPIKSCDILYARGYVGAVRTTVTAAMTEDLPLGASNTGYHR